MSSPKIVAVALLGIVALVVIDQLFLAAERRGWVYWRRSKASSSRASSALLAIQSIFEPDREHVVEERAREEADIDVAADADPLEPPDGPVVNA